MTKSFPFSFEKFFPFLEGYFTISIEKPKANSIFLGVNVKSLIEEPIIKELAKKYNKTPGQIILNWHLLRGYVIIPKTATESRLKENFECDGFELTAEEVKKISSLNRNARSCDLIYFEAYGNVPAFA